MLTLLLSILLSIYHPPVSYEITLAGNFGEPRPHHFHGGLDIRTDNVEGKPIYAIGDGYVSRVTMGKYGFGNAVYVTHPEGYTSIYCHLKSFSPRIHAAMRRYQYRHEQTEGDARFSPLECPVAQGQLIALSGNTGNSSGPHLHLEIHDTETDEMLDPYEFLSDYISDTIPPRIASLMAYPMGTGSTFNGSSDKQRFSVSARQGQPTFSASGNVGFALCASDYMQNSSFHFGIRETVMRVDGEEQFRAVVNRIPSECNRLVNSWGDYDYWHRHRVWYMKAFMEPGNTLPILAAQQNRGIIDFSEQREYLVEFILRDYKGNESRCHFWVRGSATKASLPSNPNSPASPLFRWNQTNIYSQPGMQLTVPYGLLARNTQLSPEIKSRPDALSDSYRFTATSCPLLTDGEIAIYVRSENFGADDVVSRELDPSKLYVSSKGKFRGGDYADGWVKGRIRELGDFYELEYDDEPPEVSPVSLGEHILLKVSDAKSGVASYRATIDGRFVVFDAVDKKPMVSCRMEETPIPKNSGTHQLSLSVTDNRGNTRVFETNVVY